MGMKRRKRPLRICTWNIDAIKGLSSDRLRDICAAIKEIRPDVLLLQELGWTEGQHAELRRALDGLKYPKPVYTGKTGSERKKYGNVIAVRDAVPRKARTRWSGAPWPQLLGHATAELNGVVIDILTAHIPNGTGNGWAKIDTFEALSRTLWRAPKAPRILGGDFNEPKDVRPDGQLVTFGQRVLKSGAVHADGAKTDKFGETHPRRRWDAGVRSVLAGRTSHGLRSAYHDAHGSGAFEGSHINRGVPKFFDHLLVSEHFIVRACDYDHDLRDQGPSDHSPLIAETTLSGM